MTIQLDGRPIIPIATWNHGKKAGILAPIQLSWVYHYYQFLSYAELAEMGYAPPDPDETGKTYYENAHIKGRASRRFAKAHPDLNIVATIADDSGLSVKALPNVMGVYSARLCAEIPDATDEQRCRRLLQMMLGMDERGARYTAYVVLYSRDRDLVAEGSGSSPVSITSVLHDPTPGNGIECFGYDRVTAINSPSSSHHGTPIPHLTRELRDAFLRHRATAMASIISQLEQEAIIAGFGHRNV